MPIAADDPGVAPQEITQARMFRRRMDRIVHRWRLKSERTLGWCSHDVVALYYRVPPSKDRRTPVRPGTMLPRNRQRFAAEYFRDKQQGLQAAVREMKQEKEMLTVR